MGELRPALAWWYAPGDALTRARHEVMHMVTADTPKGRLNVLLNRAAPLVAEVHPLAPMALMQAQAMLVGIDDERIVEQARRVRDLTTYIIAGGDVPAWLG